MLALLALRGLTRSFAPLGGGFLIIKTLQKSKTKQAFADQCPHGKPGVREALKEAALAFCIAGVVLQERNLCCSMSNLVAKS